MTSIEDILNASVRAVILHFNDYQTFTITHKQETVECASAYQVKEYIAENLNESANFLYHDPIEDSILLQKTALGYRVIDKKGNVLLFQTLVQLMQYVTDTLNKYCYAK